MGHVVAPAQLQLRLHAARLHPHPHAEEHLGRRRVGGDQRGDGLCADLAHVAAGGAVVRGADPGVHRPYLQLQA
ncbi:hypothetical protein G6F35_013464 [Rhizopus arrhizus]|nr:hypothetical protein G6F35_013464 [Rhizopus arrhizus]